ncbi:hypothetical protein HOR75_gp44 [Shewanella phage SppYZU05]|uniref:Uncharacterized protein n=1 Tax=Shewanella phage SppYZU05 TaxID=1970795 RepID=A0A1W6JTJ2_9CAUD|nr:hypothetical protein HOR75_gp44 [Shewanella phage SppYZU05]ARM70570.1 hypothetical protein SppYZU05_44 [Shewanella phage SppYZU05]
MHTSKRKLTPHADHAIPSNEGLFKRCEHQVLTGKNNQQVKVVTRSARSRIDTTACIPSW